MSPSDNRFTWDEGDVESFDDLQDALAARDRLNARLRERFNN